MTLKPLIPTALLLAALPTNAQSALDSIFESRYDKPDAPGAAVIIAQGDSIIYERYFGIADTSTGTPVTADTRFNIASISKQFTVIALLQKAAAYPGDLLDARVSDFFNYPQDFWKNITLADLAAHTSGVPDDRPRDNRDWCVHATDEQSVEYFATVNRTTFSPGEYYDYLNPSFILLAKVVEQLSDTEFADYMHENIFAPAGMASTYYFNPEIEPQNQSHAYIPDENGGWKEYDYGEETFFATRPDGGIYSTARDMLRWENALRDGTVIPTAWRDLAYKPRVSVTASPFCDYQRRPDTWYGLGYFIDHPAGKPVKVYHTGDNGGYQAYVAKYPEQDIKIIVLENRNDRSRDELIAQLDSILNLR